MIDAFGEAILRLGSVTLWGYILLGTTIGIGVGLIPGLSALVGCAIILPFVYGMPPELGLPFLLSVYAIAYTAGSVTAILLGIPGTDINVVTMIDGFPLTEKGEGGRALGAALGASTLGGMIGVLLAFLMIPVMVQVVFRFRAPELFMLVVLALGFMSMLGGRSTVKGLISGCMGILVSLIGFQPMSGVGRFTFGSLYLYDGVYIIPLVLGLFAIPVLFENTVRKKSIAPKAPTTAYAVVIKQMLQGLKDIFVHKWLFLRCTILGYFIGVIPAIGALTGIWVAYGHAKDTSKHPEKFGTGAIEGVIGPESTNNATAGGALLTTMTFGIPGSAVMAVMLGGFILVGVRPGPHFLVDHLSLGFLMLLTVFLVSVIGGLICALSAPYLTRVTTMRPDYLFAFVLPIVVIGSLAYDVRIWHLITLLVFAVLGILMQRFGYPRPTFILGFVLGSLAEGYFFHSLSTFGNLFFLTPISLILIAVIIATFFHRRIGSVLGRILRKYVLKKR